MSIEKEYYSWAEQYDINENKTRDLKIKSTIEILSKYEFKKVDIIRIGKLKISLQI